MMNTIVNEEKITFKELEQKIFNYVCDLAVSMTQMMLEGYDKELHAERDKKRYRDKGCRKTTIKTVYGDVTYNRHVYETKTEEGQKAYIYLLDQSINMDRIGLLSTNLVKKVVSCVTENSYRVTADTITENCRQSISHGGVWKIVQRLGERVVVEEDHLVQEMNEDRLQPENIIHVLFEEMDGVWLKMQGKNHKSMPKQEMKVSTIYEGIDTDNPGRRVLKGKKTLAGMEKSAEFHEKREAQIRSLYDADEIEYRILNGDGGSWIKDPYEPETIVQLDRFHIYQEIKRKINKDKEAQKDVEALFEAEMIDELFEYLEMYINSVDTDDENDKRAKNARELYQYLNNNREGLIPYQNRGINLPELKEGLKYGTLGVQENQNCTVITMRMKGNRKRWSENGANNMAKLLYRKENGELLETVNRYNEALIFKENIQEYIEILSAAKAPLKDGKGNAYVDVINMHVPMRDAVCTAGRKAMLQICL